ncbi:caspase family protein [Rhizobium ruizarguesonis]
MVGIVTQRRWLPFWAVWHLAAFLLVFSGVEFLQAPAFAQAWCPQAKAPDEKRVCADGPLSRKEIYLSDLYGRVRQGVAQKDELLGFQRGWLSERARCGSEYACIDQSYDAQIEKYREIARQANIVVSEPDWGPRVFRPSLTENQSYKDMDGRPVAAGRIGIEQINLTFETQGAIGNKMDALIIANSQYAYLEGLKTPSADADLVANALKTKGISSVVKKDLSGDGLDEALKSFEKSNRKDVFIFYYAGHAADINGNPSLLFPGFEFDGSESNGQYRSISEVVTIISKLGYKKVLIIFDACRNALELHDKIAKAPTKSVTKQSATVLRGLQSHGVDLNALRGLDYAISFSAAEGQVAIDTIDGKNSPFAAAFVKKLRERNTFFDAIIETRREVKLTTGQRQHPTLEMSWDEDVTLNTPIVKSITINLQEPAQVVLRETTPEIVYKGNSWGGYPLVAINRTVLDGDACALREEGMGVIRVPLDYLKCLEESESFKIEAAKLEPQVLDGVVQGCADATLTIDLNADGRPETIYLGADKYGGRFTFRRNGHSADYYSTLGCNADLFLYDIDQNGVRDIIAQFPRVAEDSFGSADALVVISGEKLLTAKDGIFYGSGHEPYANVFRQKDSKLAVLDGLRTVVLFYDEGMQYGTISSILNNELVFRSKGGTWIDGSGINNRTVSFNRDGSVLLDSAGKQVLIWNLSDDSYSLDKLN